MVDIKVVLIGEAYGEKEALFQHAFVGPSGKLLAQMVADAGLGPRLAVKHPNEMDMVRHWRLCEEAHGIKLLNVFNLRPPNNDLEALFCSTSKENNAAGIAPLKAGKYILPSAVPHFQRLWAEIDAINPNLIVALGNWACLSVLNETRITTLRGTLKVSERAGNIKVLPTYHPAAVMREMKFRTITIADLIKASKECLYKEIRRTERFLTVQPSLEEIAAWFKVPATHYAVDIESGRALYTKAELNQMNAAQLGILNRHISMIGFARDKANAIVIPFMTRQKPSLNYWDSLEEEVLAMQAVASVLMSSVVKIFQNGLYDIPMMFSYTLRSMGCTEDTMLLHHSLYPEMPKKLGFLASLYTSEIAWKSMYSGGEVFKRDD